MDSIEKLAAIRAKKSKKTAEELIADTTGPYDTIRLDDPMLEEKMNLKKKYKPFYDRLEKKNQGQKPVADSKSKAFYNVGTKELIDMIAQARSEQDVQKLLMNARADQAEDMQTVNTNTLGDLIEKRFGADDVSTTEGLDSYLKKMKATDYPALDDARKIIYPDAKELSTSYERGLFGNGTFYSNPTMEKSIRLGSTPIGNEYNVNSQAKAVLGHELGHANDLTGIHLSRMKDSMDPNKYEEIIKRIGDLKGGESILEHSNNIEKQYPTAMADMLTPQKLKLYREQMMDEAPSANRENHLGLLNKYEQAIGKDLGITPDKKLMETYIKGVDPKKVTSFANEAVSFRPDRSYVKEVLEKTFSPGEAESIRSAGHHAIRKDILNDVGHFEARNILRLAKGKGLLGMATPLMAKGLVTAAGGMASIAAEASDAEDAGGSSEQSAFLRERDEMVRRGNNMKQAPPLQKEALQGMYENIDSDTSFDAKSLLGPSVEDAAIENPQRNPELRKKVLSALTKK